METLLRLHSAYKKCCFANCRCIEPGYKRAISQPLYRLSTRNLLRRFIGQCINEIQC